MLWFKESSKLDNQEKKFIMANKNTIRVRKERDGYGVKRGVKVDTTKKKGIKKWILLNSTLQLWSESSLAFPLGIGWKFCWPNKTLQQYPEILQPNKWNPIIPQDQSEPPMPHGRRLTASGLLSQRQMAGEAGSTKRKA